MAEQLFFDMFEVTDILTLIPLATPMAHRPLTMVSDLDIKLGLRKNRSNGGMHLNRSS